MPSSRPGDITTRPETEVDRRVREWMERNKLRLLPAPKGDMTFPTKPLREENPDAR